MPEWSVLAFPLTWLVLWAVLALSDLTERRVLSPQALIVRAATTRRARPEHAERLVAVEFDRLLRDVQRTR